MEAVRHAITDGQETGKLASVVEASGNPGVFGLVALNPDGSAVGGSGGSATVISNVDTSDATFNYFGDAAIGSANSAAAWKISRMTKAAPFLLRYATGGASNCVWDDRASLTYS